MARVLVDDLTEELIRDGEGGTVRVTLDGDTVELDLAHTSQQRLREVLQPYFDAGRIIPKPGTPKNGGSSANGDGPSDSDVRAWCRENGIEVNSVGRVNGAAREAYYRAHAGATADRLRDAATSSSPANQPAVETMGNGARPRAEQIEIAQDLLDRGVPTHTIVSQVGMSLEQVRELQRQAGGH